MNGGRSKRALVQGEDVSGKSQELSQLRVFGTDRLSAHFDKPAAEIIRHLIAHAKPEVFPKSWHMKAAERHAQQARSL
jgi:hypothetical protein